MITSCDLKYVELILENKSESLGSTKSDVELIFNASSIPRAVFFLDMLPIIQQIPLEIMSALGNP